jgi:lipoic acid synthetase
MILGDTCTRNCSFCAVHKGEPSPPDQDEPRRIARAIRQQKIKHAVITSVTRDDLPDGGAGQFARVITELRQAVPEITIEILIPDLAGNTTALMAILQAGTDVLNHNLETVPSLYPVVRPMADYRQSLQILASTKENSPSIVTKSGIMVGLGETAAMVREVLQDLRRVGCNVVTIGQYFQPHKGCLPVSRHISDEEFDQYKEYGLQLGFQYVAAGRFVRSSYQAGEIFNSVKNTQP